MTRASGRVGLKRGTFSPSLLEQEGAEGRPSVGRRKGLGLGLGILGIVVSVFSLGVITPPWKQCPKA